MQPPNYNLRIANTIKALRKLRGLTQQELANALFIERSAYSKLENSKVAVTVECLKEVTVTLKTSVFQILAIADADVLINFRLTSLSEILIRYTSFIQGNDKGKDLSKDELEFIITKMKSCYSKEDNSIK
jgi:transcriptional regulator with XRE-family HTH domain